MRPFDALSKETNVFGPHLLEASAGTGKTFAIEHVFVRLLLESKESPIELEKILTVTFTKAAARELRARIRSNLERAEAASPEASFRLEMARSLFERAQIFTIHGFCYRMLKEFAFEANRSFSLPDPDKARKEGEKLKRAIRHFLECELRSDQVSPEQMAILLKKYAHLNELVEDLLKVGQTEAPHLFSEFENRFLSQAEEQDRETLLRDFERVKPLYKVVKGDLRAQVIALATKNLAPLIREKGSLFTFLSDGNRKLRAKDASTFTYPNLRAIEATIQEASSHKQIFKTLAALWKKRKEELFEDAQNPDEILESMQKALEYPAFREKIQEKYEALIIDEFQDTDPIQWEIFQRLFLAEKKLQAVYFVGDPKQSIYRFRNADIYTYVKAKELLGEEAHYSLGTNFRSSPKLVSALNALFKNASFRLPKKELSLPYQSVLAGSAIESEFHDGKGALHALFVPSDPDVFANFLVPYAISQIETLSLAPASVALLVKDRYQAESALQALEARNIPAFAKSHTPIGKTPEFQAIRSLFEMILSPKDLGLLELVRRGPFASFGLPTKESLAEGLVPFLQKMPLDQNSPDGRQIVEDLLEWEQLSGFSFEGLAHFLASYEKLTGDEGGRRRIETDTEAVQIVTLHSSKGLEFEIVFAFGLIASQPDPEEEKEEADAEKQRQLYVALTRAKKRLYFPVSLSSSPKNRSPMDLFSAEFPGGARPFFEQLSQEESFTFEELAPISLPPLVKQAPPPCSQEERRAVFFRPSYLHSFTTLAQTTQGPALAEMKTGEYTLQSMPRGAETGILIHKIFEMIFSGKKTPSLIADTLKFSLLKPWIPAIEQSVEEILALEIFQGIEEAKTEIEFLFKSEPHFMKGFIDLIFLKGGKYYILDWKTNWLEEYSEEALRGAMDQHDYWLQAAIYKEALRRHLAMFSDTPFEELFGGALYFFIRGKAMCQFVPDDYEKYLEE